MKKLELTKALSLIALIISLFSCAGQKEEIAAFSNVDNPREGKLLSYFGETVIIKFDAAAAWEAEVRCEGDWARIKSVSGNTGAGRGTVKLEVDKNSDGEKRPLKVYLAVKGYPAEILAEFEQAGGSDSNSMGDYLIAEMEKRLTTEYLWAAEYNKIVREKVSYADYLSTNLTKLGDINIEDGGYYRDYSSNAGKRYIYSFIQEVNSTSEASTKAPELLGTFGLGIGPLFASLLDPETQTIGLTVGYVYRGSPAEAAGLRRGDTIFGVNGNQLTNSNYQKYMSELYYSPSGSYTLNYARYIPDDNGKYTLATDRSASVTTAVYGYDPVLYAAVLKNDPADGGEADLPAFNIGYLATESFDLSAQFVIEDQINQFISEGITELVLDLRYNVGGAVAQSRYLASAIVGKAHDEDIFFKATFVDGKCQEHTFGYGYAKEPDGLAHAPELGLKRLFVIVSENTASASELIINGLRGVDFPVTVIGSRTEGKNVGMDVTQINYNGRKFNFAPITFRCTNARNEGDYKDGIEPERANLLNNQNSSYSDDIDNVFPYAFGNWDDFNFNYALLYSFCDITGQTRPDLSTKSSDSSLAPVHRNARKLAVSELNAVPGRFGNLIYR